jgi:CMP-N,N'-diacetyllegionaminic acid synthase
MNAMSTLAIIPARGGSKGVPGKNLRPIAGLPLIAWSIRQAKEVPAIRHVVVSTDSEEIAAVAREHGAEVPFLRPSRLAEDTTPTEPVMRHALDWYVDNGSDISTMVLLQPTSPLRLPGSLASALARFQGEDADSLLGVCENHHFFWRNPDAPEALYDYHNRPRRQDIDASARWYRENGSIYVTRAAAFRASNNRLCGRIAMHTMKEEESWEIDSLADFLVVEALIREFLQT